MSMRFRDAVVWVTGASSGIGAALGPQFHAEGAHVVLSARREDALRETAARCAGPGETMVHPLDVSDQAAVDAAAAAVLERFGRIDVLVNNAGITQRARVADTDMAVIRRVMDVDYFGPVMLAKAVLPAMLERGSGRIACVTSVAGKYGSPMRSSYCGAKHALHGFFDSLREEVRDRGVDVTLVVPGAVRTNVSVNALTGDGSPYDRMDPFLENGMPPETAAARILDAVHARTPEALIADGVARRNVVLKRWSPWLLSRTMRRKPGRGNTVPRGAAR
jgi:dehydrogenase/reductase SDR family protein 7B